MFVETQSQGSRLRLLVGRKHNKKSMARLKLSIVAYNVPNILYHSAIIADTDGSNDDKCLNVLIWMITISESHYRKLNEAVDLLHKNMALSCPNN